LWGTYGRVENLARASVILSEDARTPPAVIGWERPISMRSYRVRHFRWPKGGFSFRPLTESERARLHSWASRKVTPYRLVIRSRIVILAASGKSHREIAAALGVKTVTVTRWLRRFSLLGPVGLLRDAPRSAPNRPLSGAVIRRILSKTFERPASPRRYWSTRSLAREVGVSHTSVRRVWERFGVNPRSSRVIQLHQWGTGLPRSVDVSGVFFDPPRWAVTLCLAPSGGSRMFRKLSSVGSRTGAGVRRPGELTDLAECMRQMRRRLPTSPWRGLIDPEFRAFLGRVVDGHHPEERMLLLTGPDPPASTSTARWLDHHPEISFTVLRDPSSLVKATADWIAGAVRARPIHPELASLGRLESDVESWATSPAATVGPFAWIRD
jgi:transposase